jgi:hypothetical protein
MLERVSGVRLESACLKRIQRVEFCLLEKSQRSETQVCIPKENHKSGTLHARKESAE